MNSQGIFIFYFEVVIYCLQVPRGIITTKNWLRLFIRHLKNILLLFYYMCKLTLSNLVYARLEKKEEIKRLNQ
jgi:hypothetical protein